MKTCSCKEVQRLQTILDEWGISDEPPIKIIQKILDNPIYVGLGDTLTVKIDRNNDASISTLFENPMIIDKLTIYSFKDALGYTNGVMGVMGESQ
jgi:hypothetical protein